MSTTYHLQRVREIARIDDTSRADIDFTSLLSSLATVRERRKYFWVSEHAVKVQRRGFSPSVVLSNQPVPRGSSSVINQDVKSPALGRNLVHELVSAG